MRNFCWVMGGVCAALSFAPRFAAAQSNTIPPLTPAQLEERRRDAKNDLVLQGSTSMPGLILEGGKILTQRIDPGSIGSAIEGAELGSKIISYTVTGAKIAIGTGKDGWEGFKREGTQAVFEKGGDLAGQALVQQAVKAAVGSGIGLGTAAGVGGISFTTGSLFGTYLRNSDDIGQSLGLRGAIGDEVDTFWFNHTPNSLKELASGTKQIDIDDPAVMQQIQDAAQRNVRQAAFDGIQRENLSQQQQIQAASVQMTGELSGTPPAAGSPYDSTANSLQSILDAARAAQATRQSLVTPKDSGGASGRVCKLDPQTGCHPGHNEATHPGGCKLC